MKSEHEFGDESTEEKKGHRGMGFDECYGIDRE